jgi:flagellar protein FlgJ
MLKGISSEPALAGLRKDISPDKLKKACTEFESVFINYMLKSMRASIAGDGLFLNNNAGKMIESMFDENLSLGIAKGGGIGLSGMLFEKLKS